MHSLTNLIFLAGLLGEPAEPRTSFDPKIAELVQQLGDKSYRVREIAARDLLKKGSQAVPALRAALNDKDPQVAERSKQLLPLAAATERNEKLAELLKEPLGELPKGLSGVKRFIEITGDSKANRELYAEMMASHHQIIDGLEEDPTKAARLMAEFSAEAYSRWQQATRTGRYSYDNILADRGQVALFLFVRGDARYKDELGKPNQSYMLINSTKLRAGITGTDANPAIQKLFLSWLSGEKEANLMNRGVQIAAEANLKETLPILLKAINAKGPSINKAQTLPLLAKLGTKENIKDVQQLMDEKTNLGTINFGNGQLTTQVRDVALGVSVHLAGEKLADYGFDTSRFGGGIPTSYFYFGFPNDEKRDAAHAKWKEFIAKPAKK